MTTQPRTLVCFGDSNTHGSAPMTDLDDIRRFSEDERWPGVLARELGSAWRVYEEGLPGRTTVHPDPIEGSHLSGLAAVPVIIGTHTQIDLIVMMLGVNDLKARFSVSPSDIAASVEVLVRSIRTHSTGPGRRNPRILLVAPAPIIETGALAGMFAGGQAKSEALAPLLRESAQRLQVDFLDAGQHVRSSAVDGTHLHAEQHLILGLAIAQKVKSMS